MIVTYNGYTLPTPLEKFTFRESYRDVSLSCVFLVTGTTASDLISKCTTAETALNKPYGALTLSFGGSSEYSFSHSSNTGLLSEGHLDKLTNEYSQLLSRGYRFTYNAKRPADLSGYNYRQEGSFSIAYDPAQKRTVNFSMTYTAGGSNSSLTNYQTYGAAWAASVLLALGGTYEKVGQHINTEMEDKITRASLTYAEILTNQTEANKNEAGVVNSVCNYSVNFEEEIGVSPTGGYTQTPAVTASLSYSCQIDSKLLTTEDKIEYTYRTVVRPWLIKNLAKVLGLSNYSNAGSTYVAQSESFSVNPYTYSFSGNISLTVPKTTDQIVRLSESVAMSSQLGLVATKLWDGRPNTYSIYNTGARTSLRRSITVAKLSQPASSPTPYPGENWVLLSQSQNFEQRKMSVGNTRDGLNSLDVYVTSYTEEYLLAEPFVI